MSFCIYCHRDDDDINDVASMAGVNLSEESANILATNSGLVGAVTHSCKDETFLSCTLLQRRMLEIGETLTTILTIQHLLFHFYPTPPFTYLVPTEVVLFHVVVYRHIEWQFVK